MHVTFQSFTSSLLNKNWISFCRCSSLMRHLPLYSQPWELLLNDLISLFSLKSNVISATAQALHRSNVRLIHFWDSLSWSWFSTSVDKTWSFFLSTFHIFFKPLGDTTGILYLFRLLFQKGATPSGSQRAEFACYSEYYTDSGPSRAFLFCECVKDGHIFFYPCWWPYLTKGELRSFCPAEKIEPYRPVSTVTIFSSSS